MDPMKFPVTRALKRYQITQLGGDIEVKSVYSQGCKVYKVVETLRVGICQLIVPNFVGVVGHLGTILGFFKSNFGG